MIFEFITGGGLAQEALPKSLAKEGLLMLMALVNKLVTLSDIQLTLLLDKRCKDIELPDNIKIVWVSSNQHLYDTLPTLIEKSDWVWVIAPEMDFHLYNISKLVEEKGKYLLNSSAKAVAICSDKLLTIQVLNKQKIETVAAIQLDKFSQNWIAPWVIKPKDGAGCLNCFFVANENEFSQRWQQIESKSDYLIQPFMKGKAFSLSCLFKDGDAWLLCCNLQHISIKQGQFKLNACEVNISIANKKPYQQLIKKVAKAIPGLWGYVGIDILQPEFAPPMVLEINPRLTTSYIGIADTLGINVAKVVIDMVSDDPVLTNTRNYCMHFKL